MVPELRKEEILKSIKKRDISYIKDLAAELNISLSTVRRDRLGKAILEKEQNGTKAFKAENDKEYYRQQMGPHCGMNLKLENSRKRTAVYKEYFCVITTYKQYQVIRFFIRERPSCLRRY